MNSRDKGKRRSYYIDGKMREAKVGAGGYMYIWLTDGGFIKEHRYVMEQYLGRKLSKEEEVHHIDGDRSNNRIDNLVVLTKSQHSKLHRGKEKSLGKKFFGNDNAKRMKKVIGKNEAGDVLRYESFQEARRAGFFHVEDCCKGRRKKCGGFVWSYDE